MINFTKMHGCGNDYIYVNAMQHEVADPSGFAIRWSDRHKGIGSDGLVLIDKAPAGESADFSMRIFNADGSEAMMCGNASRCIGKYLYERGLTTKTEIRLHTLSGIKVLKLHLTANNLVESVTVDMGTPIFDDDKLFKTHPSPSLLRACSPEHPLERKIGRESSPSKGELEGVLKSLSSSKMGSPISTVTLSTRLLASMCNLSTLMPERV